MEENKESLMQKVIRGYEKIAFGKIHDAVRLVYSEEISPRTLKGLDLMCVSEIKRLKDGAVEVKFYDRLEALRCMSELDNESDSTGDFLKALEDGARALEEKENTAQRGEKP